MVDTVEIQDTDYPIKCLVIKDFSENYIRYDLLHSSMVQDLIQFIRKIPMESFFNSYKLEIEKTGKTIQAEDNLFNLELKDYDIIKMIPSLYDFTTAKEHFDELEYILNTHPNFNGYELIDLKKIVYKDYEKLVEDGSKPAAGTMKTSPFTVFEYLFEKQEKDGKHEKDGKQIEKQQKEKEEKLKKSIEEVKQIAIDMNYKKLNISNIPYSLLAENKGKPSKFRCLNSMFLSGFNSKIGSLESNQGDLMYIEVITLENNTYFITSSEKGFFINNSKQGIFNPSQHQSLSFTSYTLPGLLSQISPLFKENFSKTLSQNTFGDEFLYYPTPTEKYDWLVPVENPFYYEYRYKGFTGGIDNTVLNKEWNEEYQGILDIKNIDNLSIDSREKLLIPFYNSFKQVAIEGAKLIANKKIKPFSINESLNSGYYIYGNIFMTILEDSNEYISFNKETQSQTVFGAKTDLRNINYLNKIRYDLDLSEIYFGLCSIITYKGLHIHAQVMTPGIIFNSEKLILYGEFDDNKIRKDDSFLNAIQPSLQKLGLTSTTITLPDGSVIEKYFGHPELKGIRGVDQRNYIFDLVHLLPRDINFNHKSLTIRPELLTEYRVKLFNEEFKKEKNKERMAQIQSEMDSIAKSAKDQKEMIKLLEKPIEEREKLYSEIEKVSKEGLRLNTVYDTSYVCEVTDDEKRIIEKLADFSKEMLLKMLDDCFVDEENLPGDSESLKKFIHRYGISSKYYSLIIEYIEGSKKEETQKNDYKKLSWLKSLIQREMLVKSASSVFNNLIKSIPTTCLYQFSSYFLNVFLGHSNQIKSIESFNTAINSNVLKFSKSEGLVRENSEEKEKEKKKTVTSKEKDKKKRRQKKKNKNKESEIDVDQKYFLTENLCGNSVSCFISYIDCGDSQIMNDDGCLIKPSIIWNRIISNVKSKYNYQFPSSSTTLFDLVDTSFNKYGMLRDFCKKVGLSIEAFDYQFPLEFTLLKSNELTESQLIFHSENILGFFPVLKEYNIPSEVLKPTFLEAESFFNQGHLQSASEKYKQVIILCHEISGSIHYFSAVAHKKLAYISFYEGNYQNAINLVRKAIIIYEKLSEYDSILVSSCYSELGSYYSSIGDLFNAFKAMYKAWEITTMIYPKNHPELASKILVLSYFFVDIDCISNALELLEQSIKINSQYYEENSQKMSKLYLLASQLYLRNYNIKDAIVYYEKYTNIIKSIYKDEKVIESTEKILDGFKQASDELKKKNTFVKGKENTKKIFEELIGKFVSKAGFDERIGNKMFLDQNDIQLYEYMVKNGYVKGFVEERKN